MSDGSEFHRSDAATGKERRTTVVSRNGGTSSCCDDEDRSRCPVATGQIGDANQLVQICLNLTHPATSKTSSSVTVADRTSKPKSVPVDQYYVFPKTMLCWLPDLMLCARYLMCVLRDQFLGHTKWISQFTDRIYLPTSFSTAIFPAKIKINSIYGWFRIKKSNWPVKG